MGREGRVLLEGVEGARLTPSGRGGQGFDLI